MIQLKLDALMEDGEGEVNDSESEAQSLILVYRVPLKIDTLFTTNLGFSQVNFLTYLFHKTIKHTI